MRLPGVRVKGFAAKKNVGDFGGPMVRSDGPAEAAGTGALCSGEVR